MFCSTVSYVGNLEPSQEIIVKLYDRDLVGQDFLGRVVIPVSAIVEEEGDSFEKWFLVQDEPTENFNRGPKLPGEIKLKLHYPKVVNRFITISQLQGGRSKRGYQKRKSQEVLQI